MFHTHPTTTAILKTAKKCFQPEFQHVAHFSNGGFAVSDKYRLFWTGDISGEPNLPTFPSANFPSANFPHIKNIIPAGFMYELSFKITKNDKKVLKAFLAIAKLNTVNKTVILKISKDNILFEIKTGKETNLDNILASFILETKNSTIGETMTCSVNYEYLLDFLLGFENEDFKMKINLGKDDIILPLVFECLDYSYLLSCLK